MHCLLQKSQHLWLLFIEQYINSNRVLPKRVKKKKNKTKQKRKTLTWVQNVDPNIHLVTVWLARFATSTFSFFFFFFFFFLHVNSNFTWVYCSCTVQYCSCTIQYCLCTVYVLKNIKNGSHDTIYTFKNYFLLQYFQFSVFSNNKLNPNGPLMVRETKT